MVGVTLVYASTDDVVDLWWNFILQSMGLREVGARMRLGFSMGFKLIVVFLINILLLAIYFIGSKVILSSEDAFLRSGRILELGYFFR